MEYWKDIEGYEGLYQVSNCGNVKSLDRVVNGRNNSVRNIAGKILKRQENGKGRCQVQLCDSSVKQKPYLINQLVAKAFLDNVNSYKEINHKDENPLNNHVDNLEWCTRLYNVNYGTGIQRSSKKRMKKIMATSLKDNSFIIFDGIKEVEKKGLNSNAVSEPILYGWRKDGKHNWYTGRKQSTIWNFDRPTKNDLHQTMKPIELCDYPITNSSMSNCIVLDTFGGSGSTLIACEQTNRICHTIEMDEKYAGVIVKRYIEQVGAADDVYILRDGVKINYADIEKEQ